MAAGGVRVDTFLKINNGHLATGGGGCHQALPLPLYYRESKDNFFDAYFWEETSHENVIAKSGPWRRWCSVRLTREADLWDPNNVMPFYPEKLVEKDLLSTKNIDQPHNSRRKPVKVTCISNHIWVVFTFVAAFYLHKIDVFNEKNKQRICSKHSNLCLFSTDLTVFYQRLPILSECAT